MARLLCLSGAARQRRAAALAAACAVLWAGCTEANVHARADCSKFAGALTKYPKK